MKVGGRWAEVRVRMKTHLCGAVSAAGELFSVRPGVPALMNGAELKRREPLCPLVRRANPMIPEHLRKDTNHLRRFCPSGRTLISISAGGLWPTITVLSKSSILLSQNSKFNFQATKIIIRPFVENYNKYIFSNHAVSVFDQSQLSDGIMEEPWTLQWRQQQHKTKDNSRLAVLFFWPGFLRPIKSSY